MADDAQGKAPGASEAFGGTRSIKDDAGKEWQLSRLTGQSLGTLEEWIKDGREADARASVYKARGLNSETKEDVIARARSRPVSYGDIYEAVLTQSGFRRLVLLSLQATQPHATEDTVTALEFEQGSIIGLALWIVGLDGLRAATPTENGPPRDGEGGDSPPAERAAS